MSELEKQLEHDMSLLQLTGMRSCYQELAEKASKSKLRYEEYLALLFEEELRGKTERSVKTKIHKAKFPFVKTLEQFDFSFQPNLNEREVLRLSSLDFIEKGENLIFLGPPGVGKTHLAAAFGVKACQAKYRVLFTTVEALLEELMISVREGSIRSKLLSYSRLHLLILDELGYTPINREQAHLLFRLVCSRYEKGSLIITSNYNFDDWGKVFEDLVSASAIIDRLVHHANLFIINGSSYRLKDKLKKGGECSASEGAEEKEETNNFPGKRRKEVLRVG